jgi:hypothetical protein
VSPGAPLRSAAIAFLLRRGTAVPGAPGAPVPPSLRRFGRMVKFFVVRRCHRTRKVPCGCGPTGHFRGCAFGRSGGRGVSNSSRMLGKTIVRFHRPTSIRRFCGMLRFEPNRRQQRKALRAEEPRLTRTKTAVDIDACVIDIVFSYTSSVSCLTRYMFDPTHREDGAEALEADEDSATNPGRAGWCSRRCGNRVLRHHGPLSPTEAEAEP